MADIFIHTDGASRNNPGKAAIGVILYGPGGQTLGTISRTIGITTNNQAEYQAVIAGLEKALQMKAREIVLKTDSELVVKQIKGIYRVKHPDLKPLHQKTLQLLAQFAKYSVFHVARAGNAEADSLANLALDS